MQIEYVISIHSFWGHNDTIIKWVHKTVEPTYKEIEQEINKCHEERRAEDELFKELGMDNSTFIYATVEKIFFIKP